MFFCEKTVLRKDVEMKCLTKIFLVVTFVLAQFCFAQEEKPKQKKKDLKKTLSMGFGLTASSEGLEVETVYPMGPREKIPTLIVSVKDGKKKPVLICLPGMTAHKGATKGVLCWLAKEKGISGVTVYRGIMGYGQSSKHISTSKFWELTEKLPVMIEIIDRTDLLEHFYKIIELIYHDIFYSFKLIWIKMLSLFLVVIC